MPIRKLPLAAEKANIDKDEARDVETIEANMERALRSQEKKELPLEADVLKAAAYKYWKIGCDIVLLKDKKPLHEWQRWIEQRQTEQEFNALPWQEANMFCVVCGTRLDNGLFFAVIDHDVKNLPADVIDKGKQILEKMPITRKEKTPSGGLHQVYFSHAEPKSVSAFHNTCALELIGKGKLCIMAPSQGYSNVNDNLPTEVQDIEALFNGSIGAPSKEPETWFNRKEAPGQPYTGKDPNCIREIAKGTKEGLRNEYGIRLASYYGNCKQYQTDSCLRLLKTWNKLNEPALRNEEIETMLRSALQGNYVYGCLDPILKEVCSREGCPLAKKEARQVTEQDKTTAEKLLADPKLLDYVLAFGRKRLIGEDHILLQNFVVLVSGQTKYPISEILSGHSGSGKNESIRAVKPLIPEGWLFEFTTSTPEAIKYIPENFSGTLIIYELAGIRS